MKKKVIMGIVISVVVVLIGVAIFLFLKNADTAKTTNVETTKNINETGITVDQSSISFANMKLDNTDLHLTDAQKEVLRYFDNDYFQPGFWDYDGLNKYPDVYKGAQIDVMIYISKIIKSTDTEFEILGLMCGGSEEVVPLDDTYIVIKGKQSTKRPTEGDAFRVFGRYSNINTYKVDGKSYTVPTIEAFYTCDINARFDKETINNVAKYIFGNDFKMSRESEWSPYQVTLDNQSNENFKSFDFDYQNGSITDTRNDEYQRSINISADLKHYIITSYNEGTKILYLEYYDRDFKKLWGREFDNVTTYPMDYTSKKIAIAADNDLYIIDTVTGKDLIEPAFVGEKIDVMITESGTLLVSKTKEDMVMKVSDKGEILWRFDSNYDMQDGIMQGGIQVVNGKYVFIYNAYEEADQSDPYWNGNDGTAYSCYIVFDKDGNIALQEKAEKNMDHVYAGN